MVCLQALNDFQNAQRQAASKEKEALKKARADSDAQFFGECSCSGEKCMKQSWQINILGRRNFQDNKQDTYCNEVSAFFILFFPSFRASALITIIKVFFILNFNGI